MVKGNTRGSRKKRQGGRRTKGWRLDPLKAEAKPEEVEINGLPLNPPIEDLYIKTDKKACVRIPEVKPFWILRLWRWIVSRFVK